MTGNTPTSSRWRLTLGDEAATQWLAGEIATAVGPGDLITLSGDLGAGKTTMARAIVRALCGDPTLDVPSPTYTLMQTYQGESFPIVHADLFRIDTPDELAELGWDEASEGALVLVEWPERAGGAITADRLDIALSLASPTSRIAVLTGSGHFAPRLERMRGVQELLAKAGWTGAKREFMQGDASVRAYERLTRDGETAVLMISPPRADGPPIRYGKPYSAIAKLAESVHAFVAMDMGLASLGFSAPRLIAQDLEGGYLLLEDLGSGTVTDENGPVPERYGEATALLAHLHGQTLPSILPVKEGRDHSLPEYDRDALLIELELILDWYAPQIAGIALPQAARNEFTKLWSEALQPVLDAPLTWTLRDYHSPNLIWLPEREGLARVGLVDFQDAVLGHPAYDVASLLQDARVNIPEELELKLLSYYAKKRREHDAAFDAPSFISAYATLGAQRATKIAGIFARLDKRDGKPQYLKHLPRVERYLARNLDHPVLSGLKVWYQNTLPRLFAAE